MKLTYWVAECLDDSSCYNIREKTKKEVEKKKENAYYGRYGPVHKIEVEYADGFDLLRRCLNESGIDESPSLFTDVFGKSTS